MRQTRGGLYGVGLALLLLIVLGGCGRVQNPQVTGEENDAASDVMMAVQLPNETLRVGQPAEILVTLRRDGAPVEGATVEIEGNMTHAGMEPLFVEADETEPGIYRARLEWTMGGGWFLTARATLPDGTTVERVIEALDVSSN